MVKIYCPNKSNTTLGGGFTFLRNFRKALKDKVQFVDKWQDCDIVFVFGITSIDKGEIHEAVKNGKHFVLRVDNIPRKSRNKRQSPAERLKEFGEMADVVVYQSRWAKEWAGYFSGDGMVINNGVDTSIFYIEYRTGICINSSLQGQWKPSTDIKIKNRFLYVDFNTNPNKRFEEAIYWFEREWRKNNKAELTIVGNVPKMYLEHPEFNWDLNVPAKVVYLGVVEKPEDMALIMRGHDFLIYPSFAEAYPNTILEAMACGMEVVNFNLEGGTIEAINNSKQFVKNIDEMGDEYLGLFNLIMQTN